MLTYILLFIIIILIVLCVYFYIKMLSYKKQLEEDTDLFTYNKNKISMIEYQYRNFKEGQNAFTTLRKMSDILKDYYR